MSKNNAWYARFPGDFIRDTGDLSLVQDGAYNRLLDHYYATARPLPNDMVSLHRICRAITQEEKDAVEYVANSFFNIGDDGLLRNKRADYELLKNSELREERARVARAKWGSDGLSNSETRSKRLSEAREKGTHTEEEWDALQEICGQRCVFCGISRTDLIGQILCKDHIVPIYQGGSDGIDNIQPSCRGCNSAKGPDTTDRRPTDWKKRLQNACKMPAKRLTSTTTSTTTSTYTKEFLMFWDAYPKKKEKKKAFAAWKKAKDKPDIEIIIRAIKSQKQSAQWRKENGQYIKHPTTWLNGGCWDDEPDKKQSQPKGYASIQ